uniref:Conserved oligomeric Golgi complex subunit 2 n=1 Tax=Lygus hesperus TaxID=30085 RepID=A0A146M5C5_LYGHE
MPHHEDNPVPLGSPDLCFDSRSFTKEHFSVDEFLQEHRNRANLEAMRDDLGMYLKVLRSAMIDLINKDYADFVDLSSNLIGLDVGISRIQVPLGQLREELIHVKQSLEGAMNEVNNQLAVRRELRDRKRSLRSLSRVHSSLKKLRALLAQGDGQATPAVVEPLILERATSEYVQLLFHTKKCQKDLKDSDSKEFEQVDSLLIAGVNKLFLQSIHSGSEGRNGLQQCLSFYHTLNRLDSAENLYRKKIVAPVMQKLINQHSLKSLPGGLPALYGRIIDFIDGEMKILMEVTQKFNRLVRDCQCNFLLRSFWPEVEERIETELSPIFAAGDPDVFYKRYKDTLNFLEVLSERCGSRKGVIELHSHPNFLSFMERWNLPVYFQLRFQEIVRQIEKSFASEEWAAKRADWKLLASETAWDCLLRCWEDDVFLLPIAHKFWKLSLQIVSRYVVWAKKVISNVDGKKKTGLNFLVCLYTDVESLNRKLPEIETLSKSKIPKVNDETSSLLKRSLDEMRTELDRLLEEMNEAIVKTLCVENVAYLQQVNNIPRLFRRTNREAPTKPLPYVLSILDGPNSFFQSYQHHPKSRFWLQTMFSRITKQYYSSVDDVLNSVKKTEESLRRLKKARDKSSNVVTTNDQRVGDDNKIRQQLLVDVHAYLAGVESFGLKKGSVEQLAELLLLVGASQTQ